MIDKQVILFDMDGTLLPMDIDEFTEGYFKLLCRRFIPLGYDRDELIKAVWAATGAMVANDGTRTNEEVFWEAFGSFMDGRAVRDRKVFDEFYENEFAGARDFCGFDPAMAAFIKKVRASGFRTAVATNPIFPMTALRQRLEWAGLDPDGFELITAYENSRYCSVLIVDLSESIIEMYFFLEMYDTMSPITSFIFLVTTSILSAFAFVSIRSANLLASKC